MKQVIVRMVEPVDRAVQLPCECCEIKHLTDVRVGDYAVDMSNGDISVITDTDVFTAFRYVYSAVSGLYTEYKYFRPVEEGKVVRTAKYEYMVGKNGDFLFRQRDSITKWFPASNDIVLDLLQGALDNGAFCK